ncbi:MAG: iron ABC transporter permease [Bordetella sp.]|nr:MAG: iron ABC transporter permease [Bordetella sp.]
MQIYFSRWLSYIQAERGLIWLLSSISISLFVLIPFLVLAWWSVYGDSDIWKHLIIYVIPYASKNTITLLIGVGFLVSFLGTGCAWLVTAYDFPSKRTLEWALLLPLSVPTYIVAFAYLDILHPIGPVQSAIRYIFGFDNPRQFHLPDIRSIYGAIFVLGFVLYPYVYLSTRALFMMQASNLLETARSLGSGKFDIFFRVAFPLARPAISIGLSLALLETLNDIGASEFLGVQTLTTSIYTTWITRSDLGSAAQISIMMLIIVISLIFLENFGIKKKNQINTQIRTMKGKKLKQKGQICIAIFLGWIPVLIGFITPFLYLILETYKRLTLVGNISHQLLKSLINTLILAFSSTIFTLIFGLIIAWAGYNLNKNNNFNLGYLSLKISSLGYAIPATVLAIGLLTPFNWIDHIFSKLTNYHYSQILMGSIFALIFAYIIRFLAISTGYIEAGLAKIQPELEEISRLLGESSGSTLRRVYLPILRPTLIAAAMLIFVDSMKELPATLLLRPMNFDTLSTWLYAEAVRGTYEEGAIAALCIVLAGLLPVAFLSKINARME